MDRRVQKTKDAIITAFIGLMAEKDFEQITINEIADRANVNRGTVYLHYVDKYDLLEKCIDAELEKLFVNCVPGANTTDFSTKASMLRTFEYLEQNAFFYSTIFKNKGVPAFRRRLHEMALNNLREQIDMSGINKNMNREVLVQFLASAAIGSLEWWITNSMPYPAKDMVEQVWTLLERVQLFTPSK